MPPLTLRFWLKPVQRAWQLAALWFVAKLAIGLGLTIGAWLA